MYGNCFCSVKEAAALTPDTAEQIHGLHSLTLSPSSIEYGDMAYFTNSGKQDYEERHFYFSAGRALLSWENQLSRIAATIDFNWLHIFRIAAMERRALLARLKAYPTSTLFIRLQTIMDAASLLASSWTCQSSSIYMSALGTTPPPTNGIAWKFLLLCVKRNICAADTALWNLAIITNRALTWYPPPPLLQDQRRRNDKPCRTRSNSSEIQKRGQRRDLGSARRRKNRTESSTYGLETQYRYLLRIHELSESRTNSGGDLPKSVTLAWQTTDCLP